MTTPPSSEFDGKRLMSVTEFARLKQVTPQAIRKAIKYNYLHGYKAFKVGKQWVVEVKR